MSTPFLVGFTREIVARLLAEGLLDVTWGGEERVIRFVAGELAAVPPGGSLITSLARSLIRCPDVQELYADDERLKGLVQDLESTPATWIRG